jgi:hypothetical protein
VWSLVSRAARAYDASRAAVLRRALELYRVHGFEMKEAEFLGVLDPAVPAASLERLRSRKHLRPLQTALNPPELWPLTEDKIVFDATCRAAGLPVPELYAVVVRDGSGWTTDGEAPRDDEAWARALERVLPAAFVSKPARGHFGLAVRTFERHGDHVLERGGVRPLPVAGLRANVLSERQFGTHLLQERIRNHHEIERLSGTSTLQTVRLITLTRGAKGAELLFAYSKIVTGDARVDNFMDGSTGNGLSRIDLETGALEPALLPREDRLGLRALDVHPRSGVAISGFRMPFWHDIVALAERAAGAFAPARALAWDIGVSPGGPVLIEANALWGPMNEWPEVAAVQRRLEEAAAQRPRKNVAKASVTAS